MRLSLFLINLSFSVLGIVLSSFPLVISFQWEDDDSVIVEALTSNILLKRRGGKFPFTWPWQSQGFAGRARAENNVDPDFTCYTTLGEQGVCATLRECYPMLYSVEYGKERHEADNSNLIDTLKSISGPCDMPNFSKFRINMPDSLICCPSRIVFPEPGYEFPSSTTTERTTTTPVKPVKFSESTSWREKNKDSAVPTSSKFIETKTPKPTVASASVPDAVAAHFHREYICGFKNESATEGMTAEESSNRFPWIVALVGNRGHFCAGSLIDRYNVLTSASCTNHMTSEDVSNLQVYLGDYKLHSVSDGPLIVRKVARIIYHRAFDNQTLKNDIAILRFKLPAPVGTPRVLPVCLPKKTFQRRKAELEQNMLVGVEATLAGWGRTWNPSPVPVLRKSNMTIWANDDCRIQYGYLARSGITDHMLCAYPSHRVKEKFTVHIDMDTETMTKFNDPAEYTHVKGSDASIVVQNSEKLKPGPEDTVVQDCIGDTGGPLMVLNEEKRYEQVGIVSWNIGCSRYAYIHTRVGSYLNWIEKNRHR